MQSNIVRFSRTGGEDDLLRPRTNQTRHLSPRVLNRRCSLSAGHMLSKGGFPTARTSRNGSIASRTLASVGVVA